VADDDPWEIEQKGLASGVADIKPDPARVGEVGGTPRHLPEAAEARPDRQHRIIWSPLAFESSALDDRQAGPHSICPLSTFEELGSFIKAGAAQEPADGVDARIA